MSKKGYYAVAVGRRPGIYTAWGGADGAETQVKGFPGGVYQGFASRGEAEHWLASRPPGARARHSPPAARQAARPPVDAPGETAAPSPASTPRRRAARRHDEHLAAGRVVIYTDGASTGNPGPGGYGAVLLHGDRRRELSGGFGRTTNNRMELMACIEALACLQPRSDVVLYADSSYVVNGITLGWAKAWRARNWLKKDGQPAENIDLWARLLDLCDRHSVAFVQVRGHAGNPENERCDQLAVQAAHGDGLAEDRAYLERFRPISASCV